MGTPVVIIAQKRSCLSFLHINRKWTLFAMELEKLLVNEKITASRLFTVLYFAVNIRSSRLSALRYGLPSCKNVKTTWGAGAVFSPPPGAIIPDARPLGTIAVTVRSGISKRSHEKIGDCEQSTQLCA